MEPSPTEICGHPWTEVLAKRFWSKVRKGRSCWLWLAGKCRGYGHFAIRSRRGVLAHRVAYELLRGPIPDGLVIDHLCRNSSCVRPDHLEAVEQRENILRGCGVPAINARKMECKRGHRLVWPNLGINGSRRFCRTCSRDWHREDRRKRRADGQLRHKPPTKCPRGHAYDEANILRNSVGNLMCRKCKESGVLKRHKTHCPKGHPYSGPNLSVNSGGKKRCRECRREQWQRWTRKRLDKS